jgi:hypothetical protein
MKRVQNHNNGMTDINETERESPNKSSWQNVILKHASLLQIKAEKFYDTHPRSRNWIDFDEVDDWFERKIIGVFIISTKNFLFWNQGSLTKGEEASLQLISLYKYQVLLISKILFTCFQEQLNSMWRSIVLSFPFTQCSLLEPSTSTCATILFTDVIYSAP